MPIGADIAAPHRPGNTVMPSSQRSDWATVNSDPTATDNAAATITNPLLSVTRAAVTPLRMPAGTTVQIRLRYNLASIPASNPVIQPFGFDLNNVPQRLKTSSGTHEITLTVDSTNDVRETIDTVVWGYTEAVEVDAQANEKILVAVKTAISSLGVGATIQARVK